jgi:hypothetical protein
MVKMILDYDEEDDEPSERNTTPGMPCDATGEGYPQREPAHAIIKAHGDK